MSASADVDSLLSELDGLLKDSPPGQRRSSSAAPAAPRLSTLRPAVEDDIDSLLSSLGGAEAFASKASKAACAPRATCPPAAAPSSSSAPDGSSCATKYASGLPECVPAHHTHACHLRGSLRCSKCDFKVVRFGDQKWSESVDYMFFRNFMGEDLTKLRTKLQPQDGVAAHACQCSWCTVESWGAKVPFDFWFRMR